jgi:hypothetical protein
VVQGSAPACQLHTGRQQHRSCAPHGYAHLLPMAWCMALPYPDLSARADVDCAEAMQESVKELKAVTSQLRQVMLENQSQTRSASKISFGDVQQFQVAASVEVIGEGDISFDKLKEKKPEADSFKWWVTSRSGRPVLFCNNAIRTLSTQRSTL